MFLSVSESRSKHRGRLRRGSLDERTAKWWRRCGSKEAGFWYETRDGKRIRNTALLTRIVGLVIPPAWTDVRISPKTRSQLQAVGKDSRGRTQYLYHPHFVQRREAQKFRKLSLLGASLSRLRRLTGKDLRTSPLSKEAVLAAIIHLIDALHFRLGSERSVREYQTFGITTLRSRHVTVETDTDGQPHTITFNFVGKHHIRHRRTLADARLADVIAGLKDLPGSRLFKFVTPDGSIRAIRPSDVNEYIRTRTGAAFTSKDLRTWSATLHAARELDSEGIGATKTESRKKLVSALRRVAERLGNTLSVCRSSYVHPAVIRLYEAGRTLSDFLPIRRASNRRKDEDALLRMLTVPLPRRH